MDLAYLGLEEPLGDMTHHHHLLDEEEEETQKSVGNFSPEPREETKHRQEKEGKGETVADKDPETQAMPQIGPDT
ncbi:hypothetical protein llap_8112 [Limosa lapponica baueri]|uniref:Uncharacterized protein n=1 Tax=Limosa lapponica baueri TaxID=1758121 RepID=A0A2I0U6A3_LIMLA|nr:hypothetical protein llap_8112 [Limosa lapponica baueri]